MRPFQEFEIIFGDDIGNRAARHGGKHGTAQRIDHRIQQHGKNIIGNGDVEKPDNISEMFVIAEKLSQGIPFSRIDLYNVNQKIYFGEVTFFPDSGFDPNLLPETDLYFGNKINLEGV